MTTDLIHNESKGYDEPGARAVQVWRLGNNGHVILLTTFEEGTFAEFAFMAGDALRRAIAFMDAA